MAEQSESLARFVFSPDQLSYNGYGTASGDFIRCLNAEGSAAYLAALHTSRNKEPIHITMASVREEFDAEYGPSWEHARIGEAFEDGALVGTLIAEQHYRPLMPELFSNIARTLGDYESYYGIFSERRNDFITAVRNDSGRNYMRFASMLFPIVSKIYDDKYNGEHDMAAIAEGASFILDRLQAVHSTDYSAFKLEMEHLKFMYPVAETRRNLLGEEALRFLSLND